MSVGVSPEVAVAGARSGSVCLCTAADAGYFGLCLSLVTSIKACPGLAGLELCVFDLGLGVTQRALLQGLGCRVAVPGWDFPGIDGTVAPGWYRAMTARPFLPAYFPGHAVYVWIDSDAWVQEERCVLDAVRLARDGALAICEETDRGGIDMVLADGVAANGLAVETRPDGGRRLAISAAVLARQVNSCMREAFADDVAERVGGGLPYNVGVFALSGDSPAWELWRARMREAFARLEERFRSGRFGQAEFMVEQMAINAAIHLDGVAVAPLPQTANWTCHLGLPAYDPGRQRFVDPASGEAVGIVHLVDLKRFRHLPLRHPDGTVRPVAMHFINRIV